MNVLHLIIAALCIGAAIVKFGQRHHEHFLTRFILGVWYLLLFLAPPPSNYTHLLTRTLLVILLAVEILSPVTRAYYRGRA